MSENVSWSNELLNGIQGDAEDFSRALRELAVVIDAEISQVFRKSILDTERNIIRRSPVLTGAYRASHGIANMEPAGGENIAIGEEGIELPAPTAGQGWQWKVGDGDIWLYNNVPYALRIEDGHSSKKAPQGVYRLAIPEFTQFFQKEVAKTKALVSDGIE